MKYILQCMTVIMFSLFVCTGCSTDEKDLERLLYISAIGVDYKDDQYHVYLQAINFQSTAKTESGEVGRAKVEVAEGTGTTANNAIAELYRTAQEKIFWGHITAIVISEAAFKQGIDHFIDSITRFSELRLTPWVFGATEPIDDIFSTVAFFGQSPLSTILHEPEGTYSQASNIKPIKLQKLISQMYESGFTSCIPLLSINKNQWLENQKSSPKLVVSGAIFLKNVQYKSTIPLEKLKGLRWIQEGSRRTGISVPDTAAPSVQIIIRRPKTKIKLDRSSDQLQYNVNVKADSYILSRFDNQLLNLQQLTEQANEVVEDEIRELQKTAVENKTDILNLENLLYRYHYNKWESSTPVEERLLQESALKEVQVNLKIIHASSGTNARKYQAEE